MVGILNLRGTDGKFRAIPAIKGDPGGGSGAYALADSTTIYVDAAAAANGDGTQLKPVQNLSGIELPKDLGGCTLTLSIAGGAQSAVDLSGFYNGTVDVRGTGVDPNYTSLTTFSIKNCLCKVMLLNILASGVTDGSAFIVVDSSHVEFTSALCIAATGSNFLDVDNSYVHIVDAYVKNSTTIVVADNNSRVYVEEVTGESNTALLNATHGSYVFGGFGTLEGTITADATSGYNLTGEIVQDDFARFIMGKEPSQPVSGDGITAYIPFVFQMDDGSLAVTLKTTVADLANLIDPPSTEIILEEDKAYAYDITAAAGGDGSETSPFNAFVEGQIPLNLGGHTVALHFAATGSYPALTLSGYRNGKIVIEGGSTSPYTSIYSITLNACECAVEVHYFTATSTSQSFNVYDCPNAVMSHVQSLVNSVGLTVTGIRTNLYLGSGVFSNKSMYALYIVAGARVQLGTVTGVSNAVAVFVGAGALVVGSIDPTTFEGSIQLNGGTFDPLFIPRTVSIPAASWVTDGEAFKQDIAISGVNTNMKPSISMVYSGTTEAGWDAAELAMSLVDQVFTYNGGVTLRCWGDKPATDFSVYMEMSY